MKRQKQQRELEEKIDLEQEELQKKLMEEFEASGDEILRIIIKKSKHSEDAHIGAALMKKESIAIQELSYVLEKNLGLTLVPSGLISALAEITGASIIAGIFFDKEEEQEDADPENPGEKKDSAQEG